MTLPYESNDIVPPEGYVFVVDGRERLGHLSVSDEEQALPLCGANRVGTEVVGYLPASLAVCPACFHIADEASTRVP